MRNDVVIVSAARSAFSKFGGVLRQLHSIEIASQVMGKVMQRVGVERHLVEVIYYGMCIQSEAAIEYNVNGRQALLKCGFPADTVCLSVDRACCSSLSAIQLAYKDLLLNEAEVSLAVGAENMSNTPFVLYDVRWASGLDQPRIRDHLNPVIYTGYNSLAKDAGRVALEYGIGREEQDEWALRSHRLYHEAKNRGFYKNEIIPIEVPQKRGAPIIFEEDELPRPDTSVEKLSKLKPVYGSPTVTAGNAPGLDAGASAILFMKRSKAEESNLKPLGRVVSIASVAREPEYMAAAPAPAIEKALDKAGLGLDQMDRIEINEAFAAMPLVTTEILGKSDRKAVEALRRKTNVNGGAVAIGHPVGASGARILMTLMYELRRVKGRFGVCSICGGLAQADAAVIEAEP